MKQLFTNILVPLGLEENAELAIEEALRISSQWQCHIHLLYCTSGKHQCETEDFEYLREGILDSYRPRLSSTCALTVQWMQGLPEKNIIAYCNRNAIDLILLSRIKKPFWRLFRHKTDVCVERLLKKVESPVLTVLGQPTISGLKNIVLPVGDGLPMRKLAFATYLARSGGSTIHLISADDDHSESAGESEDSLLRSYRLLRENTSLPVECCKVAGGNLADVAWRYARDIKADLILIHPGKESLLSGFLNGVWTKPLYNLYSRALFNVSRIPVMTIS